MNNSEYLTLTEALQELGYYTSRCDLYHSALGNTTLTLEVQKMTTIKISDQTSAISAIRGSNFIVGSVDASGNFSIASNPAIQYDAGAARTECKRLAWLTPGRLYFFTRFAGAEMVPTTPVVSI